MTTKELAKKVWEVRYLQRRFFAGEKTIKGQAIRAERELDRTLAEILEDRPVQATFLEDGE